MSRGKFHTFSSLRDDVDFVEIPIIQRDYAQGRPAAADVRKAFLSSLRNALQPDSPPLDLDFVYGNVVKAGTRYLSVLDGQQRLTTLFLLHWYLATRDGEINDFRSRWMDQGEGRSRFTYETRPSAAEFFHALMRDDIALPEKDEALSAVLLDAKWFFDTWRHDPTVSSSLVMLDAIHNIFGGDEQGQYNLLVKERRVAFHFLDLPAFGLSDDLYIKMNSRGKPLTAFENFKAWLVERAGNAPWASEFALGLDQEWLDFFWDLSGRSDSNKTEQVDYGELFIRFFYLQAYFESCSTLDDRSWVITAAKRNWLSRIREARGYVPLGDFEAAGVLGPTALVGCMRVLRFLSSPAGGAFRPMLRKALAFRSGYDDQLHLHALSAFLRSPSVEGLDEPEFAKCLSRWVRVTNNLLTNSRVDDFFISASITKGLNELASDAADLYTRLAEKSPTQRSFSKEQASEESRKAALVLQDPQWEEYFIEAESHWYLQGRIGFLLDLSRGEGNAIDQNRFRSYSAAMRRLITRGVLESPTHLLPRALLSLYDYFPPASGGNHTFCISKATTYRDRIENWLSVFQDSRFGKLLDAVGEQGVQALQHLIDNAAVDDWRFAPISRPSLLDYCQLRMVRKSGTDLLLLSKQRTTGYFAELRSFALFREIEELQRDGALRNVRGLTYKYVYGEDWPEVSFYLDQAYRVSYSEKAWHCRNQDGAEVSMPEEVLKLIPQATGSMAPT